MSWDLFLAPERVGPACDFALKALTEAFHRPVLAMNQEGPVCVTFSGQSKALIHSWLFASSISFDPTRRERRILVSEKTFYFVAMTA